MSLKINLGCGPDIKDGYENVDFRQTHPSVKQVDLSIFPWPWTDDSADQILMLDFLEHFSYRKTDTILYECHRILKDDGELVIQVPDFEHCALAAIQSDCSAGSYKCNRCGNLIELDYDAASYRGTNRETDGEEYEDGQLRCSKCDQTLDDISEAAIMRLYGGQDYEGNWHQTAFTFKSLSNRLRRSGFAEISCLECEHQNANWNFKLSCKKSTIPWK